MAAAPQNFSKMISAQLRNKANEFLNSRKHANNLADILQMFEVSKKIVYSPQSTLEKLRHRLRFDLLAILSFYRLIPTIIRRCS